MVVVGGKLALGEPQPEETVIGAIGDGALQFADGRLVVLRLVFALGRSSQSGDEISLLLVRWDAVDQLLAPIARRVGQLLGLVLLRQCRRGDADETEHQQRAQHRIPPRNRCLTLSPRRQRVARSGVFSFLRALPRGGRRLPPSVCYFR